MPGSVANAAPSSVLPLSLCQAFMHSRAYALDENEYKNGESQRDRKVDTSRKQWRTSRRLTETELNAFRTFYFARKGHHEAFYFYDPWDSEFTHDPTGVQITGRYTVRFDNSWEQMRDVTRTNIEIVLIELA